MIDFDLNSIQPRAEHFDLIDPPERLFCWGIELGRLIETYGKFYPAGVFKALLEGFGELAESKDERRRERQFVVWGGDYLDSFWVGVPADLGGVITDVLGRYLQRIQGYHTQEFGYLPSLSFTALFTYDHGRVIEYSDDSVAGGELPNAYGSRVTVSYRLLW
jgi:hypothetical protein